MKIQKANMAIVKLAL